MAFAVFSCGGSRRQKLLGPLLPTDVLRLDQTPLLFKCLEDCVEFERLAFSLNKSLEQFGPGRLGLEIWLHAGVSLFEELPISQIQHCALSSRDRIIIHAPVLAQRLKLGLKFRRSILLLRLLRGEELRKPFEVDV